MARDMIEAPADELAYEQALVRSRWFDAMRRQGHRQCTGVLADGLHRVCALGLLSEVAGLRGADATNWGCIAYAGGLTGRQMDMVWRMNDGDDQVCRTAPMRKHTFAEIANIVEGWFAS